MEETDTTDQSEEEVTDAEAAPAESIQSKNGNIRWSTVPPDVHGRTAAANIIKMTPGVTRFAVTRVSDIKTCFDLFLPLSLKKVIIAMTNLEGKKVHGNKWKDIDETYLVAYSGVLLLAGVYRSSNEASESLWDASTGRNIFRATMSLRTFQMISRVLRFDNRDTRAKSDKLAPIRDVWERWVQLLPLILLNIVLRFYCVEKKTCFCPFLEVYIYGSKMTRNTIDVTIFDNIKIKIFFFVEHLRNVF